MQLPISKVSTVAGSGVDRNEGVIMDTKTWTVGQEVRMVSGEHTKKAIVVKITEKYVQVEPIDDFECSQFILFHHNGETGSLEEGLGRFFNVGGGVSEDAPRYVPGTKYGPWKLQEVR